MLLFFLTKSRKEALHQDSLMYSIFDQLNIPLNKKKCVPERGFFGYYSLIDWWTTSFNENQQTTFIEAFKNNSMSIPPDRLFHGKERPFIDNRNKKMSVVSFLCILQDTIAQSNGCEEISQKFIAKCAQLIDAKTSIIDQYIYYLSKTQLYDKLSEKNSQLKYLL